jgi:LPXTG-motif cell wall-anchored protein
LGRRPHGAVRTGVGGSVLTGSTAETAGGVAMLAVAAGGGVFLVRRRGQGNQA